MHEIFSDRNPVASSIPWKWVKAEFRDDPSLEISIHFIEHLQIVGSAQLDMRGGGRQTHLPNLPRREVKDNNANPCEGWNGFFNATSLLPMLVFSTNDETVRARNGPTPTPVAIRALQSTSKPSNLTLPYKTSSSSSNKINNPLHNGLFEVSDQHQRQH